MTDKKTIKNNCTQLNTIIILLVAIFFSMVGMGIGYYMNRPSIPKYYFHPNYIRYISPFPVLLINKSNMNKISQLPLEKKSKKLLQVGNYLRYSRRGYVIADSMDSTVEYKTGKKLLVVKDPLYDIKTYDYGVKKPALVQKIRTQEDIQAIENDPQLFLNPEIVKVGFYVEENTDSRSKSIPYKIVKGNNPKNNKFASIENSKNYTIKE